MIKRSCFKFLISICCCSVALLTHTTSLLLTTTVENFVYEEETVEETYDESISVSDTVKKSYSSTSLSDEHDVNHSGWNVYSFEGGDLDSGNYYLNKDIFLTSPIIIESKTVTLCLNGYNLLRNNIFVYDNSDFTLCDCSQDNSGVLTGTYSSTSINTGGVITVYNSTFTMNGGTITNNYSYNGGAIYLFNSSFIMNGGNITNNKAYYNGGGIYFYSANPSTTNEFLINGGTISNNTAGYVINGSTTYGSGGGICLSTFDSSVKFEINNSTINNNSSSGNRNLGGGISYYSSESTNQFYMNNTEINNNNGGYSGGGIYFNSFRSSDTFELNGNIDENTAYDGGGIFYDSTYTNNSLIINGVSISHNYSNAMGGAIYYQTNYSTDKFIINSGEISNNTNRVYEGSGIYYNSTNSPSFNEFTINYVEMFNNIGDSDAMGGAIYCNSYNTIFTVNGGKFYNNISSDRDKAIVGNIYNGTITINGGYFSGLVNSMNNSDFTVNAGYFDDTSYNLILEHVSDESIYFSDASLIDLTYDTNYPNAIYKIGEIAISADRICYGTDYNKHISLYNNVPSDMYSYSYESSYGQSGYNLPTDYGTYKVTASFTSEFVTNGDITPKEYYDGTAQSFNISIVDHNYDDYDFDHSLHWRECINTICDLILEESLHYGEHDNEHTYYDENYHTLGCVVCSYDHNNQLAAHSFTEWTLSSDDEDIETRSCSLCDYTQTRNATINDTNNNTSYDSLDWTWLILAIIYISIFILCLIHYYIVVNRNDDKKQNKLAKKN